MSKIVYRLIDGNIQSESVDDSYALKENETFNQPADGLYQPFSIVDDTIVGANEADWIANNNIKTHDLPKTNAQLLANLTQQLATSQMIQAKTNAQFLQQNATLIKQIDELKEKKETNNG